MEVPKKANTIIQEGEVANKAYKDLQEGGGSRKGYKTVNCIQMRARDGGSQRGI